MADQPKGPELSPEEKALQENVQQLGLKEETPPATPPAEAPPAAPPAAPAAPAASTPTATPAAPAPTTAPLSEKELKDLQDKAGWGVRAQAALDQERAGTAALKAENERLKKALGVTTTVEPTVTTPEELAAVKWFDKTAAERIAALPEEVLANHPAMKKRDNLIYALNDRIDQNLFLMRFPHAQQPVVQERVLPILQQQRVASGWQKGYGQLWEEYREGVKAQAELVGLAVQPTTPAQPPAAPHAAPAPTVMVPPSLSGVPGSGPEVPRQPVQMTPDEARVFGLA